MVKIMMYDDGDGNDHDNVWWRLWCMMIAMMYDDNYDDGIDHDDDNVCWSI
jgi:hypothetical protein